MLGLIGGSGIREPSGFARSAGGPTETPFGKASAEVVIGRLSPTGAKIIFLPRHGSDRSIAPHRINYRANIWALSEAGVDEILAINSVGSLRRDWEAGTIVIPDQLIDYTWGRECTFGSTEEPPRHVDFTLPFDPDLAARIQRAAEDSDVPVTVGGTYGCTQGPRFETAAEITRMASDGCDLVGMTAMPEAILARELGIPYAIVCSVGNLAAGLAGPGQHLDHEEIAAASAGAIGSIIQIISRLVD